MPAITAGARPAGELEAPSDLDEGSDSGSGPSGVASSKLGTGNKSRRRVAATRPTRVVGLLDHPILPMPPVR